MSYRTCTCARGKTIFLSLRSKDIGIVAGRPSRAYICDDRGTTASLVIFALLPRPESQLFFSLFPHYISPLHDAPSFLHRRSTKKKLRLLDAEPGFISPSPFLLLQTSAGCRCEWQDFFSLPHLSSPPPWRLHTASIRPTAPRRPAEPTQLPPRLQTILALLPLSLFPSVYFMIMKEKEGERELGRTGERRELKGKGRRKETGKGKVFRLGRFFNTS